MAMSSLSSTNFAVNTNLTSYSTTTSSTVKDSATISSGVYKSEGMTTQSMLVTAINSTPATTNSTPSCLTRCSYDLLECFSEDKCRCAIYWVSTGFAAAICLMVIARILVCAIRCCCNKSPSNTKGSSSKETAQAEPDDTHTLALHSDDKLGGRTGHHPPIYKTVCESASPYAEVRDVEDTMNPANLYAEVAAKQPSMKRVNLNTREDLSVDSTTVIVEPTGNEYDDAIAIREARMSSIQTGNKSNNYELATEVEDTVAPVYSDVTARVRGTAVQDVKDQKPISPFATNYAKTIKSLADKLKIPSNDLEANNADDHCEEPSTVEQNDSTTNEDMQFDDADNVGLYEEASAVKLDRLANLKAAKDAKHSNMSIPSQRNHMKYGKETSDTDMTLVENNLYGATKG